MDTERIAKIIKRSSIFLFFLFYIPFLYSYGYKYLHIQNVDLPTLYLAARITFIDRLSVFSPAAYNPYRADFNQYIFPYWYPPPSLLMFRPLLLFSYDQARLFMLAANHLLVLLLLFLLIRLFKSGDRWKDLWLPLVLPAYLFVFQPLVVALNHGHFNLFNLLLLVWFWFGLKKGWRPYWVALPLALMVLTRTYWVLLLPLLFFRRRFAEIGWFLLLEALTFLAGYLALPKSVWPDWWRSLGEVGGFGTTPPGLACAGVPWNQSLNGFLARIFQACRYSGAPWLESQALAAWLPALLALLMLGVTWWLAWLNSRRNVGGSLDLEISAVMLAIFLVSPFSWEHHLLYVLPAVIVLALVVLDGDDRLLPVLVGLSALLIAWSYPLDSPRFYEGILKLVVSLKFFAAAALWLVSVVLLARMYYNQHPKRRLP